jgi:mono/diheme cytochrome c family protein
MKTAAGRAALLVFSLAIASPPPPGGGQKPAAPKQSTERQGAVEQQHLIESLNGKALYQAYCATCHGADGTGGGPAATALKKAPPDLTGIAKKNGGKFPSIQIQKIISGESVPTVAHGSREMPVWGPIFGQIAWDQDLGKVRVYNLAEYLESLQKK